MPLLYARCGLMFVIDCLPRLTWYFENINHAIPLFLDHDSTSEDRARGAVAACSPDVVEAMIVVTAKLSRRGLSFMTDGELCAHIDRILGTSSLRDDIASDSSSLDQFRQSCILAFYEHHQCPGQQAWMRVGKLVRAAYWSGLDQIERMRETSHRWKALTEQEVEEWRLVWWCAYCLDSYANVSTGMPCGIDERYVNTTLPREAIMIGRNRVSLPTRPEGLVDVVRTVFAESPPKAAAREMQLLSIAVLRDIGRTIQQRAVMSPEELVVSVENAERRLYALRLALPCNFFHPSRNVFESESAPDHHLRLVTIHHILMAQILITICHCRRLPEGDDWVHSWQRVLELCQDVVALARQWNSSFCLSVDPALSIIAFVSLVFLDLHIKFATGTNETSASSTLLAELEHCETILLLFLERFGESWTLSRLLICQCPPHVLGINLLAADNASEVSFRGFKEALPGSIKYRQVQAILRHFDSPLHPRWLTFLQSAGDISQSYC